VAGYVRATARALLLLPEQLPEPRVLRHVVEELSLAGQHFNSEVQPSDTGWLGHACGLESILLLRPCFLHDQDGKLDRGRGGHRGALHDGQPRGQTQAGPLPQHPGHPLLPQARDPSRFLLELHIGQRSILQAFGPRLRIPAGDHPNIKHPAQPSKEGGWPADSFSGGYRQPLSEGGGPDRAVGPGYGRIVWGQRVCGWPS
jgi:hypothetical protein